MTWAPGEPQIIRDRLISDGGWFTRPGCAVFNLYRPSTIRPRHGDPSLWTDHIRRVFGDDGLDHILSWLAHRVQRPQEKINHALVLGGLQGIGKDTLLEPVKAAIGPWNFAEVSPQQILGRFNGFLRSVILRINEARDLGEFDRFQFYDHLKAYTAAPPDVLRVDEKHRIEYSILNVCGVIITTNHKTDGIYLPADDRRHYVAWSDRTKESFTPEYWRALYGWFDAGGREIVANYLANVDLSGFDPKAPPPKTAAFAEIVASSRAPEDDEMSDALEALGWPTATTLQQIKGKASADFLLWLSDRKNSRRVSHRLESCGYVAVPNDGQKTDGRWKIGGNNIVVYAKNTLSVRDRILAVRRFVEERTRP